MRIVKKGKFDFPYELVALGNNKGSLEIIPLTSNKPPLCVEKYESEERVKEILEDIEKQYEKGAKVYVVPNI